MKLLHPTRFLIVLFFLLGGTFFAALATQQPKVVFHILPHELDEAEDSSYAHFIGHSFQRAAAEMPALVILEIDTPGGELSATLKIKNSILGSTVPTLCYINKNAISAGSLLALSCKKLVMAPAAVIGAATPVLLGQDGMQKAPEKVVSATRAAWRASAETNGKNPELAEAFVDDSVVLELRRHGIDKPAGKLLTLTSQEAVRLGLADYEAGSIEEILARENLPGAEIRVIKPGFIDKLLSFFMHPVVSGLLIGLGFLGLMYELQMPGWGVPGALGILFIALYFASRILIGETGWGAPALFALGFLLLLLEVFVIPGFGIAGIAGFAALVAGVLWSYGFDNLKDGLLVLAIASLGLLGGVVLLLRALPRLMKRSEHLFLNTSLDREINPQHDFSAYQGKTALTLTNLRPAGIIEIDGERLDASSEGDYLLAGEKVKVIRVEGSHLTVKKI